MEGTEGTRTFALKAELDCRCINADQASLVLNTDSALDIPARADDDRLENVPARSSALLEEAQCFNESEGGVKALEHLIMFFPQMSGKVKMKWKPHGERRDHKSLLELL